MAAPAPPSFDAPPAPPSFEAPPPAAGPPPAADPLAGWSPAASTLSVAPRDADDGPDEDDDEERSGGRRSRRPRKRVTAAEGARQASSFELNKVVVGVVVVLAVLVIGWQASSLLASNEEAAAPAPSGSTVPPIGQIASTTTPLTTPDGVTIVPPAETTSTTSRARDCDSISSIFSTDGRGYRPCGGGFQVDLPGRADIKASTAETDLGPVTWTLLSSTDSKQDPPVRSVVVYGQLPREVAPEEAEGVQASLISQVLATPGPATTFQDLPATSFSGTDPNGDRYEGVAFVRGDRAYALATRSQGSPTAALDGLEQTFTFL